MNRLKSIGLEGVGPFKKQRFEIQPGVMTFYGLNRSNGKASKNSNFAGKSFFWSSIGEMFNEEPIVGEKDDRVKTGTRTIEFENSKGQNVVVTRTGAGKLDIQIDGRSKRRSSTMAKSLMKKVWPISAEEFQTFVHFDSRIPHPLVMGSTTMRKQFFTSFFGLHKIDAERKLYSTELSRLSKVRAAYDELKGQYDEQQKDLLPKDTFILYKKREQSLRKKLDLLQDEFTQVQEIIRILAFAESTTKQIRTLNTICGGQITEDNFEDAKKQYQYDYKQVLKDIEETEEWEQYKRDSKTYNEAFDSLTEGTKLIIKTIGLVDARKTSKQASVEYRQAREKLEPLASQIEDLKTILEDKIPEKVERPEIDRGELETLERAYQHQLEHAEQFQEGKCEACGQIVKIKDPALLRKKLKSAKAKIALHEKADEYQHAVKVRKTSKLKLESLEKESKTLRGIIRNLKVGYLAYKELVDLPSKPKKFEGRKLELKVLKAMEEEIRENLSLLKYMGPHLDTVIAYSLLEQKDKKRAEESSGINEQVSQIQDKISKYGAKLELHRVVKSRLSAMQERLTDFETQLKDEQPLKHLVQGYQDRNIKKMAIEAISQDLMARVNKYARRIFNEDLSFRFLWDSKIRIICDRQVGKAVQSSDVRRLSGAESTLFTMILICALLSYVPSSKRCNLLILDEPTANMSGETVQQFKEMVSVLSTMIPSIVIITPKSEEIYEGAKPYTVVKRNGVSRIYEGFPHQIKD